MPVYRPQSQYTRPGGAQRPNGFAPAGYGQANDPFAGTPWANGGPYAPSQGAGVPQPQYNEARYRYNPTVRSTDYYGDYQNQSYHDPYDMLYSNWYDSVAGPEGNRVRDQLFGQGIDLRNDWQRYQGDADYAYSDWNGQYRPGQTYTPEEMEGIRQTNRYNAAMTGDDAWGRLFLGDDERSGVMGDPTLAAHRFHQGGLDTLDQLNRYDERITGALGEGQGRLRGVGDYYRDITNASLLAGAEGIRGAAGDERLQMRQSELDAARDPALQASREFMEGYRFGPADTARLETQAGTAIGTRYRQNRNELGQRIAAEGLTSPLAYAALTRQSEAEQAREAADAALGATVQGRGLELETTKGREDTRLGAAHRAAQTRLGAEEMRLGSAGRAAQMRLAAEQGLLDSALGTAGQHAQLGMDAEGRLLQAGLGAQSDLARQRQQAGQWFHTTHADLTNQADATASQRSMALAQARQKAEAEGIAGRYQQGMTAADRARAAEGSIADQRLKFEEQRRAYLAAQANAARAGSIQNSSQQADLWRARQQARQQAAGQYGDQAYRNEALSRTNPGLLDSLARQAATGAVRAGLNIFTGGASEGRNPFTGGGRP